MKSLTITIGRNVGVLPMDQSRWASFVDATRRVVELATDEVWAIAPYRGSWDGVHEDAMIFYGAYGADSVTTSLREALANLATYYDQDAIAVAVGDSELVESFPTEPAFEVVGESVYDPDTDELTPVG